MACTIAVGPVLAMTVVDARPTADEPERLPDGLVGPRPIDVPDEAAAPRELVRT